MILSARLRVTLVMLLLVVATTGGMSQTKLTGQTAMKFLSIGVGARPAALGYSFVTTTDDIAGIFWNPASVAVLPGTRVFVDMNQWISDIRQLSFAATRDLGDLGVVGLSFSLMDYGEINGTAIEISAASSGSFEYVETGQVKVANYVTGLTYGRAISSEFSIGIQVKYVYSGLGTNTIVQGGSQENIDNSVSTLAFDFGTTYKTGFRDLTFSMSLRNFSREIRYPKMTQGFYLPLVFTLGFSIDALQLIDPGSVGHALVLSVCGQHPTDYLERASIGAEYVYANQYFLRAGYKINYSIEDLSFGIGVRVPFAETEMLQFDYAYSLMKYFNGVHRMSVGIVL